MSRPAPSPQEIASIGAEINHHAHSGFQVRLPERAVTQLYTAVPGKPGAGLRMFVDTLHPSIKMRTLEEGDLLFWIDPQDQRQ